ncbi:MAG TPA: DUF6544 family protein [Polyangiaceae bacterium]|nr:DUF6544 family protein [Polyangiaceae bacterium]
MPSRAVATGILGALFVALLVPAAYTLAERRSSSLGSRFHHDVAQALTSVRPTPLVTEADLVNLPAPVAGYLRYANVVGKPRVTSLRAHFHGQIRAKPEGDWLDFRAEQHNFYAPRARYFYIESSMFGLPFKAYHRYANGAATMEVRVASLLDVVDARGPEMNVSETVTMLNDMCVLAPATLIDPSIVWQTLDSRSVRATFENAGNTVSAVLLFDEAGALASFYSDDRYQTADGKAYHRYRWSTPLGDYRDFGGVRLAAHGVASWRMPDGELEYGRFELESIDYNRPERAP